MQKEPILVVMAAGIGSRFGGVKQLASFGKNGECIIDYSLFDAYRAGFRRVVFIVNDTIYPDFRQKIGLHVEDRMEVRYAIQRLDKLPEGCAVPEGRQKPWGTGHAVMCCGELIDAPFAFGQPRVRSECPEDCTACVDACPCKALKNRQWTASARREELIDYHRCNRMRSAFLPSLGRKSACGLCMAACPFGRNGKEG